MILIHGGGWMLGDRGLEEDRAAAFVDAGFAAFAVDYRLAPEFPFPAAVENVRVAVAYPLRLRHEFPGVYPVSQELLRG